MSLTHEEQVTLDLLLKKRDGAKRKIHVIQVLDKSGSMDHGIDTTISTYNESVQVAKSSDLKTTISFITFSTGVKTEFVKRDAREVQPLTRATYVPSGYTALYDAIGAALDLAAEFSDAQDPNTSFLLQIMTDGHENHSRIYNPTTLKSRISALNESGRWTLSVMGPKGSMDLFENRLGVLRGNIAQFDASSLHSRGMARGATVASTQAYFSNASAGAAASADLYSSIVPDGNVDNANINP